MLTSLLLAGAVAATGPLGLSVSPAALDSAQAHHTYTITVRDIGHSPLSVRASLAPAGQLRGGCAVALTSSVSWARLTGPATFRLRPGQSRSFRVRINQPPSGRSELVAAFVAHDPSPSTGVSTSAGVGTAFRFSQPGRTLVAPCAKRPVSVRDRANVTAEPRAAATSRAGEVVGLLGALLGMLGLGALLSRLYQRRRRAR
jgi:hypothetical protein